MKNLKKLLKECEQELTTLKIPYEHPVQISFDRAKKRWGLCSYNLLTDTYTISITNRLNIDSVSDKSIKSVIIHELLHTCPQSMNHSVQWKRYADIVNKNTEYNITRTSNAKELGVDKIIKNTTYKYKITCNKCHSVNLRMKASNITKYPSLYHCRCGGTIKVETL